MEEKSNNNTTAQDEELRPETLDEYLEMCRWLNDRLGSANIITTEQVLVDDATLAANKSTRLLLFIKMLLSNGKLMNFYSSLTNNLVSSTAKFVVELKQAVDDEVDGGDIRPERRLEWSKMAKLMKTNVELTRFIVELTSPTDLLEFNRAAIYATLTNLDAKRRSSTRQLLTDLDFLTDSDSDLDDDQRRTLNQKDYSVYLLKYKEMFVKFDLFATLSNNILAAVQLVRALVDLEMARSRSSFLVEPRLKNLAAHSIDAILVNLCLARNLLVEKNESVLNLVISRMLDNKFDQVRFYLLLLFKPLLVDLI